MRQSSARAALLLPFLAAAVFLGQFVGVGSNISTSIALLGWIALALKLSIARLGTIALAAVILATIGYVFHQPSNDRDWSPEIARLPRFEIDEDRLRIENLRDFQWESTKQFEPSWRTATYDLSQLASVDAIVVPFGPKGLLAHVMLSFGFADGRQLVVSVESRPEIGEAYSLAGGAARQLELIYLFGTEPDLLGLRILHRKNQLYLYPLDTDVPFARNLLLELCQAANRLNDSPRFYATLRRNCTTTLLRHINRIGPERIGVQKETLLPGTIGELLHRRGYIDTELDWPAAKDRFRVDDNVSLATDPSRFSETLRE